MSTLDALATIISDTKDLKESAKLLVEGVAQQLDELTHDPVAIKALAADLRKHALNLAGAVLNNTQPATPAPTVAPAHHAHQATQPKPTPPTKK